MKNVIIIILTLLTISCSASKKQDEFNKNIDLLLEQTFKKITQLELKIDSLEQFISKDTLYDFDINIEYFQNLYKKYLIHCNTLIQIETTIDGTINYTLIPILVNNEICNYKKEPVDTIWEKVNCPKFKNNFNNSFRTGYTDTLYDSIGTYSFLTTRDYYNNTCSKYTSKKVKCTVKTEYPSQYGFYNWLYQISK